MTEHEEMITEIGALVKTPIHRENRKFNDVTEVTANAYNQGLSDAMDVIMKFYKASELRRSKYE